MKLNELQPARGSRKKRKRLGCGTGSGHGGTSTRGTKGQGARSGGGVPPWFEGGQMPLQRRVPARGFTNPMRKVYQVVNVKDLARFAAGSAVSVEELYGAGLIRKKSVPVKLLGEGELEHALTVKVHAASRSAQEKVSQRGGTVEVLSSGRQIENRKQVRKQARKQARAQARSDRKKQDPETKPGADAPETVASASDEQSQDAPDA